MFFLEAKDYLEKIGGEIDMIDTMDLDRNMDEQFHGYFNINRSGLPCNYTYSIDILLELWSMISMS